MKTFDDIHSHEESLSSCDIVTDDRPRTLKDVLILVEDMLNTLIKTHLHISYISSTRKFIDKLYLTMIVNILFQIYIKKIVIFRQRRRDD